MCVCVLSRVWVKGADDMWVCDFDYAICAVLLIASFAFLVKVISISGTSADFVTEPHHFQSFGMQHLSVCTGEPFRHKSTSSELTSVVCTLLGRNVQAYILLRETMGT